MFSGIRSLFGYSDALTTTNGNDTDTKSSSSIDGSGKIIIEKNCLSNDTSALLEQTLNAATTKFTEQLLPQSPSIEQLQSSSHQLLPTLIEQHEEDESRKRRQVNGNELKNDTNDDSDDDDECFNADSWELLDLVDKPEVVTSLNSAVQDDSVVSSSSSSNNNNNNNKQTSGILKLSGNKAPSSVHQDDLSKQAQRQKPKVSFETPNLVIDKQEKIEPIKSKDNERKVKSKNGKNDNRKRNKEAKATVIVEERTENVPIIVEQQQQPKLLTPSTIKKAPVLNYAAALSMKLNSSSDNQGSKKPLDERNVACEDVTASNVNLKPSGAVKRNRPVSTSSWSSSDEIEAVDVIWDDISYEQPKAEETYEKCRDEVFDLDDNESLESSGFSDCDYGYHCMNDYVMRPKKSQNKRRSGPSISSSLLNSMSKRGTDRATGQEQHRQQSNKRSAMESSCRLAPNQKKASSSQKNLNSKKNDIPDMDESWFVTPPPCFTGSNKLNKTKAREAARENALIEHPSIYIASTSKQVHPPQLLASSTPCESKQLSEVDSLTKPKAIVLKKVSKHNTVTPATSGPDCKPTMKKTATRPTQVDEVKVLEKIVRERKAPIQVRPIEPERQPGWQLRRKRCKRRPLSASMANTCSLKQSGQPPIKGVMCHGDDHEISVPSGQSSARSTPTLIDRIGSSIVANLTNLTSGFPATGVLPIQARASIEEAVGLSASRKSNSEFNMLDRGRMSKGYMGRQNKCVKLGNSLRRADRRLKMHSTPNGCSVNRKVQTSFH